MNINDLIDFHRKGAEACEAYGITPGANEEKNKDTGTHYRRRAKCHRDAIELIRVVPYDEAAELAACRAHWEKNPNCLFSDMWLGWKACAQSRDGSVGDE